MSRQFAHLQALTLQRLQASVPHDCPLVVHAKLRGSRQGGFVVTDLNGIELCVVARAEVVAAWIDGYLTAWRAR